MTKSKCKMQSAKCKVTDRAADWRQEGAEARAEVNGQKPEAKTAGWMQERRDNA